MHHADLATSPPTTESSAIADERLERLADASLAVGRADLHRRHGRVSDLIGLIVEASGLEVEVGEVCEIGTGRGRPPVPAEVVGFRARRTLLMPLGEMAGIGPGNPVTAMGRHLDVPVGIDLLGRVLDGLGRPIDGRGEIADTTPRRPANASPPDPLTRPRIHDRISLGVRALDSLVPCGQGQRLGIFAGSGVGKSSLLSMIARGTSASISVLALVGERGREVREFVEGDLGEEGLARSVVVVATSDAPAVTRLRAAFVATRIAEWFRDGGLDVLLMMDSLTASPWPSARSGCPTASRRPPGGTRRPPSPCCRSCWSEPDRGSAAPSPASTRSWSTVTTTTSRSPTPPARSWTGTSPCRDGSPRPVTSRPSTSWSRCPAWPVR